MSLNLGQVPRETSQGLLVAGQVLLFLMCVCVGGCVSCFCLTFQLNQLKMRVIILTGSKTHIIKGPLVLNRSPDYRRAAEKLKTNKSVPKV